MESSTIKITIRKVLAQYEHEEVTIEQQFTGDEAVAMNVLSNKIRSHLGMTLLTTIVEPQGINAIIPTEVKDGRPKTTTARKTTTKVKPEEVKPAPATEPKVEEGTTESKTEVIQETAEISLSQLKSLLADIAKAKGVSVVVDYIKTFGVVKSDELTAEQRLKAFNDLSKLVVK